MPLDAHLWGAAQSFGSSGRGYQQIREACPACLSGCPPFPTVPCPPFPRPPFPPKLSSPA